MDRVRRVSIASLGAALLSAAAPVSATPIEEAVAACDRRAVSWRTFGDHAAEIDWRHPSWPERSQRLMQELWERSESAMRACPTPARFWTDAAFTTLTVSFALHQPPRVANYGAKLRGLVDEIVANIRHQQQLLREGKVAPPRSPRPLPDGDPDQAATAWSEYTLTPVAFRPTSSVASMLQSVPPHCVAKPLPDVPDCADEKNDVDDAYDCWVDNLNDIAKYERWSEEQWEQAKGDLGGLAYDTLGLPLQAGAGLVHAGAGFVQAASSGDGGGAALGAGGVVAATVETAGTIGQAAAASTVGAVITALQIQGNVMMFLIHDAGRAQGNLQAKFARIRAGKCHTRYINAGLALSRCLSEQMDAQMRREMAELENTIISLDPSCNPPTPTPPPPDPKEEERKRLERERVERRQQEIADRMAWLNAKRPEEPKPPEPHDLGPLPAQPTYDSFFDAFYDQLIRDLVAPPSALAPNNRFARDPAPPDKEPPPPVRVTDRPVRSGGGGKKGVLIGGGAAAVVGAVALAGGGSSNDAPASNTTTPPTVSLSVAPSGTGMANLTSYTFTAAGTATSFTWNFGDGSTGSGASVTHVFAAGGAFAVTVTGQSGGLSATANASVTVTPDMAGAWAGPFNNRNAVIQFNPVRSQLQANDLSLTGTYSDQFDGGSIDGVLGGNGVCPCDLRFSISIPGVPTFEWVGQRVDANTLVGDFRGQGFSTPSTLRRQ